jgi:hypothetical protein
MAAATSRVLTVAALALSLGPLRLAASAAEAATTFSEEDVTAAVKDIVAQRTRDGAFRFTDLRTGEELALVFDDIRVVRGLPHYGWFPNVNFHDAADAKKKYALDFWLKPDADRLNLMAIRVHKAPQRDGISWMSITRAPLPWWWLPTIERASAVAGLPAWQVMGAIHARLATAKSGDDVLPAADNGKPLALELVDVVQPVGRSKADGRYFACVEFAASGTRLARYFADYWLEPKSGSVTFGRLKPQADGLTGTSKAATEPRCDVGGVAFDVID